MVDVNRIDRSKYLKEYRNELAKIDDQILSLLSKRQILSKNVGKISKEQGLNRPDMQSDNQAMERLVNAYLRRLQQWKD